MRGENFQGLICSAQSGATDVVCAHIFAYFCMGYWNFSEDFAAGIPDETSDREEFRGKTSEFFSVAKSYRSALGQSERKTIIELWLRVFNIDWLLIFSYIPFCAANCSDIWKDERYLALLLCPSDWPEKATSCLHFPTCKIHQKSCCQLENSPNLEALLAQVHLYLPRPLSFCDTHYWWARHCFYSKTCQRVCPNVCLRVHFTP